MTSVIPAVRRTGRTLAGSALLAAIVAPAGALHAQGASPGALPFAVGERLTYDVHFGKLKVGTGSLEVRGIEQVRGRDAFHTVFRLRGGTPLFRVDDVFQSWFDASTLASLRFHQDQDEGPRERQRHYEIYPERQLFTEAVAGKGAEQPSVAQPLDDGSFLYYVRTLPLEVGRTYELNNYFKPDRNPVTLRVLRKERVKVPAGTFDAIVVQPVIKTKGIFSEGGRAEVWLTDDNRRAVVQLKTKLSFGSLTMALRDTSGLRPVGAQR